MPKILIKFDLKKDAWNWWDACNTKSWGVDWKENISDKKLLPHIVGKSQTKAFKFLLPYLENLYKEIDIDKYIKEIQTGFNKVQAKLFQRMKKVTDRPIYIDTITCWLTSFYRFPYDYEKGYIWIGHNKTMETQLHIVIHELLHFQYHYYFEKKVCQALGQEKQGDIKEAMTVILNDEFGDITPVKDNGYKIHKELRKKLIKFWRQSKNMDEFIDLTIKSF